MKKSRRFFLAGAAVLLLSGCGKLKDVDTTSVYVDRDGTVTEAIVDSYNEDDDYTEKELKAYVDEDIASFNGENRENAVKLLDLKVGGDNVTIRLEYADAASYADYHRTEFFSGSLEEAKEAGYDFSASFLKPDGTETTLDGAVEGVKNPRVIIFQERIQIVTDQPILCVSSNVQITGNTTAQAAGDENTAEGMEEQFLESLAYVVYGK
ncbi:MAG: hypothetical protein SOT28_11665 [Fusicatenibacter sp.]|nr:hypothetical protein [Lachnospiraceae bacterium]MDY2938941.1 hypothetical protein [Fusicatenibacter sp.]